MAFSCELVQNLLIGKANNKQCKYYIQKVSGEMTYLAKQRHAYYLLDNAVSEILTCIVYMLAAVFDQEINKRY